jgi:LPS O-antigen subunit length determinant protein (WzzB/FepE family)
MKRLVKFAARLYPASRRRRYGIEFEALLEDVEAGWRELFNVLSGALRMQLTTGATYTKLGAAFALGGALLAIVAAVVVPREYKSTAFLRVPVGNEPASRRERALELVRAEREVLSTENLSKLMSDPSLDLYAAERKWQPIEAVAEYMRTRAIHIPVFPTDGFAFSISFQYRDKRKAQALVRTLVAELAGRFVRAGAGENLQVLDEPDLPRSATSPNRTFIVSTGFAGGFVAGLFACVFIKHPRRSVIFTGAALGGCLLGGGISLLLPARYVSRAVIRAAPYDHNFGQALTRIQRPDLRTQVGHYGAPSEAVILIELTDNDPRRAQAKLSSITGAVITESKIRKANVEYLDGPNYPVTPEWPNRILISSIGLLAGVTLAATSLFFNNHRTLKLI